METDKAPVNSSLTDRKMRAARLDVALYEEVEADPSTMGQATLVVVISALAAGIGTLGEAGIGGLLMSTVFALVGWYAWAFTAYLVGTRLLPEPQTEADVGELLRTVGFSSAPGVIRILGIIPGLQAVVFFVASIWMLVTMVVAVRQALDYTSTARAIGVCVVGWLIYLLLFLLLGGLLSR